MATESKAVPKAGDGEAKKKGKALTSDAIPMDSGFIDLSQVSEKDEDEKGSKMTIHTGYTAKSTIEGADTVKAAATKQNLASTMPAALNLAPVPGEARQFYGIPTAKATKSNLNLTWAKDGRTFRSDLRRLLRLGNVNRPSRTRMVLHLDPAEHPTYGPCLKIWWDEQSFIPIASRGEKEEEQQGQQAQTGPQAQQVQQPSQTQLNPQAQNGQQTQQPTKQSAS